MTAKVTPSTPGAPSFFLASAYASRSVSILQTWTYKPQKRQDVSAFALTYSLRLRSCKSMDAFVISSLPSRLGRLYDLPCSGDFAPGRGGLRQLLGMSSSPCCRFHPAEVAMQHRSAFGTPFCLRPPEAGSALGSGFSKPHLRSLSLRPGDSWSPPRETLSIGFRI